MKKIVFVIMIYIITSFYNVFAEDTCEYKSQIDRCTQAQNPNSTRNIQDFVCIFNSDRNYRTIQIILDEEFKKIDKKVLKFLQDLEKDKDKFFWKNAEKIKIDPLIDALDLVHYKFNDLSWEYAREYAEACNKTILVKALWCTADKEWMEAINATKIMSKINQQKKDPFCHEMYKNKLKIYENIRINVLKLNKLSVRKDNKKTYQQENRWNYEKLIDIINVNVWYMERIWKKWPSKTKNPHY